MPDTIAQPDKRLRGQTEAIIMKLEHHTVPLIGLNPQRVGRTIGPDTFRARVKIHDASFDRAAGRIGTPRVDANAHTMSLALDDAAIRDIDLDNLAIDRADDAQRNRRYIALRVSEQQEQQHESHQRQQRQPRLGVAQHEHNQCGDQRQQRQAFMSDEWVALTSQNGVPSGEKERTIPWFAMIVNTGPPYPYKDANKWLECAAQRHKVQDAMRLSEFALTTLKEVPAEAEIVSHQLMLRAGLIRRLSSGLFTWMPLGLRVLRKVEAVVREEMDRAGALELLMPAVQPSELWEESGRWDQYGPLLLRMRDRHDREYCFGPTHEEVITDVARRELRSYKQLPVNYYQIQTKFRDEIRPRFGVMRSREFIMKDAYSFDIDKEGLQKSYDRMHAAYTRIFERLGLKFRVVDADSGEIGGSRSQEFHVLADSGEDAIAYCDADNYASNVETAATSRPDGKRAAATAELEKFPTPGVKSIQDLCDLLGVTAEQTVKTLVVDGTDGPVALVIRGDHELNAVKAQKLDGVASPLTMADTGTIIKALGAEPGSLGPVGMQLPVYFDHAVAALSDFTCGANETGCHYKGVNFGRDLDEPETVDLRNVVAGDPTPDGQGALSIARGIEVGHIFQLGSKYSDAMKATVQAPDGTNAVMEMGCYGIGITRIVGAAIEQNHDDNGIVWPGPLAPFDVVLVPINMHRSEAVLEAAEALYAELSEAGLEVLLDDRDARPGVKFADAELIGIPHRVVIGERGLAKGELEYRHRRDSESRDLKREEVLELLKV